MPEIRGFDPSLVQRKHIFPKTFLYGNDAPGIKLRIDRFEEVLRESGENPSVYATAKDAIGYLSTGDMFADAVCVIVRNISDALKSDTPSRQLYSSLVKALSTYGDDSTIVLAAPMVQSTVPLKDMISEVKRLGGTPRSVVAPDSSNVEKWLDEYAKSTDTVFSDEGKRKIIAVSGGDVDIAQDIIAAIGPELDNLSEEDIRQWMDKEKELTGSDIRAAIIAKDVGAIVRLRNSFGPTDAAYRTFLLKIRLNVIDLLIPAAEGGKPDALLKYKSSQYANANGNVAYFIAREAQGGSYERFARVYAEVNEQLSALAMSKKPRFEELLLAIAAD